MSSRTRLVMLPKLSFKSFTCCIDNFPHIFHNLKIFFLPGKSVFERPIDLITVGNPNNVNLKREVFDRTFLTKKIYFFNKYNNKCLFHEDWTNFNFWLLKTYIWILIVLKKVTLDIDGEDGNDFSPTNKVSFCKMNVLNVQHVWSLNVFSRNCNYVTLDFSSRWK